MNNILIKNLMDFGLGEKEAEVYLALLELELGSVGEIAKATNINRSSIYVVLEALKKKGLVSMSDDKKVQKYIAISPDALFQEAKDQAKKAEDIRVKISEIIPKLKALNKGIKPKPKVRVFEGEQGILAALEDSLDCEEKTIRMYTDRQLKKLDPRKLDKSLLISKNKHASSVEVIICDNKISYILPDQNGSAIIIENKDVADTMKSVFDLAYERAKNKYA